MDETLPERATPTAAGRLLFVTEFDAVGFANIRRYIDEIARKCGLASEKVIDFVAAVNEAMTNAVRHGGGRGELRLWEGHQLTCEIRDHGPGFVTSDYVHHGDRPVPSANGGMGLWIVQQTSEFLSIDSNSAGTTVRIGATLPPARTAPS